MLTVRAASGEELSTLVVVRGLEKLSPVEIGSLKDSVCSRNCVMGSELNSGSFEKVLYFVLDTPREAAALCSKLNVPENVFRAEIVTEEGKRYVSH